MAGGFTCWGHAGEPIFVQRDVHLRVRTCSCIRDNRLRDDLQRLGSLLGNLETEVSPGFGLVDPLHLCIKRAPLGESASVQDQLRCVNGASAVAPSHLTLPLREDRLCKAVWPTERIPIVDM